MSEETERPRVDDLPVTRRSLRVLLIEDSGTDSGLLTSLLQATGYQVTLSSVTHLEALKDALLNEKWDVILSDHRPPAIDSFAALKLLRLLELDIPFVVVTDSIHEDVAQRVLKAGACDYVTRDQMVRLIPAVEREIREGDSRRARLAAEEALRTSEQRFRELVEQIPAITYISSTDESRTVFYMSPQIKAVFGLDPAECRLIWSKYMHPEDRERIAKEFAAARDEGIPFRAEYRMIAPDGRVMWFHDDALFVRNENGRLMFLRGFMQDITDRRRAEDTLRERDEQLRNVQKLEAIGRLAGGVAHDFNNLLTPILGYGRLIQDSDTTHESIRPFAEEIVRAAERASNLTRQLLAFGRKQISQVKPLVLNSVVLDMDRFLRRTIGEDVELETRLQPDLGWIQADPVHIEQVIMNLSLNARDAMEQGGRLLLSTSNVTLTLENALKYPMASAGDYVKLSVRDTGTGMSADVREKAFEPFYTTKTEGKGTGLGLSIVYGIVQQCRGFIHLESAVGYGTEFQIFFPRVKTAPADIAAPKRANIDGGKESILVVEDEPMVRRLAVRILMSLGYDIAEASCGEEAIEQRMRRGSPFDLILTDVIMPRMNGREVVEAIEKLGDRSHVVYMSGFTEDQLILRGVSQESQKLLMKPYTRESLAKIVRDALDQS